MLGVQTNGGSLQNSTISAINTLAALGIAGSTNLTQGAVIASDAGGSVLLIGADTGVYGATDWNSTHSGNVTAINGTVTAGTFGLAVDVTR